MGPRWLCLLSSRSALGEMGLYRDISWCQGQETGMSLPAAVSDSATLLECEQLLGSEAFIVDLAGRLDQVL